jgi:hypothetical protein
MTINGKTLFFVNFIMDGLLMLGLLGNEGLGPPNATLKIGALNASPA